MPSTTHQPHPLTEMQLLTPTEVATLFRVSPNTVSRWARTGKLTSIKTLGGQRRYPAVQVEAIIEGLTNEAAAVGLSDTAVTHSTTGANMALAAPVALTAA